MNTDGYLLTTSSTAQQYTACLWDYKTQNILHLYRNGGVVAPENITQLSNDFILAGEQGKPLLNLWQVNSAEPEKSLRLILPGPASCLTVCPKGVFLAVAVKTKLYIWQIASGKLLSVQQKHYQPVSCVRFSSDGDYVVTGGQDGMLLVYHTNDLVMLLNSFLSQSDIGQVDPVYNLTDHTLPIRDVFVGAFGRKSRLVSVSADQTAKIYNLSNGQLLLNLVFDTGLTSVVLDAPSWHLYVGTSGGSVKIVDLRQGPQSELKSINNHAVQALAINGSNTILAVASGNFVFTWDVATRQILRQLEHKSLVTNVRFVQEHVNFTSRDWQRKSVVRPLETALNNSEDFAVGIMQDYEIGLSEEEEDSLEKRQELDDLQSENVRLRAVNKELYLFGLEASKRLKTN